MEVILLERVENLGFMGDVVNVRPGYARNYLLPNGKALRATNNNKAHFEAQKATLEADNLKRKSEAEKVSAKMKDLSVTLLRQASETGQLFGSVTSRDVAEAVSEKGFAIKREQVEIQNRIKTIGLFDLTVRLHPEVTIMVTTNVARSEEEAKFQSENPEQFRGGIKVSTQEMAQSAEAAKQEAAAEAEAAASQAEAPSEEASSEESAA